MLLAIGSFQTSKTTAAGSGYPGYVICTWSSTNNVSNNTSTISWSLKGGSDYSSTTWYTMTGPVKLTIDGKVVYSNSNRFQMKKNQVFASGTTTISHYSSGLRNVSVELEAAVWSYSVNCTYSGAIAMTPNPVYNLSISAGAGSKIYVYRTSSLAGSQGNMSAGTKKLYYGDTLKITYSPEANYTINTHTVNGTTFTSGNTHTVKGHVTVVSSATPLSSTIGATDANIGSISTITINRYNSSYTHTLTYKFGNLTGTIETKSTNTTIAWLIPTTFYEQIPNSKSGKCTITCTTYNGNTSLGTSSYTLTVYASEESCAPIVSGTVEDINATTLSLTGDKLKLIRYQSTAKCSITVSAKNSSSIAAKYINGEPISGDSKTFLNVSDTSFTFKTIDSRGYASSKTISPEIIPYIQLTINPVINRPTPTGSEIVISFNGNYYNGSFGATNNTLKVRYRYKVLGEPLFSEWKEIASTNYVIGTSTFNTTKSVSLGNNFDYHNAYTFQIQAIDGTPEHQLSTVTKNIDIAKGEPIFDWGENDFNFHVPVSIMGDSLSIFPVEEGIKDGWHYRLWSNGTKECWTRGSKTNINMTANNYSGYYYSNPIEVPMPINFETIVFASCDGGSTSLINFLKQCSLSGNVFRFWVCGLAKTATDINITYNLYVMGN